MYKEDHISTLVHSFSPTPIQQGDSSQSSEYLCACCPLCFGGGDLWSVEGAQDE